MEQNFILTLQEIDKDYEIYIAINYGFGSISSFIPLKQSAFIKHPRRPSGGTSDFGDWYLASKSKEKWEAFLSNYINSTK